MLNSQIILGLYREANLQLMLSSPPLAEHLARPHLTQAHDKFILFQRRGYLNSSSFLVKCFHHEQHNFVIVCLLSGYIHSKAGRIFSKIIDECTRAKGVASIGLHTQLAYHITDQRFLRSLYLYDFKTARRPKKAPKQADKDEMALDFELGEEGVDGSRSAFGFLLKQEAPSKSEKVR